jgi:pyruvate,water dikinase
MLGRVPDTLTFHPTRRRYPAIAARLPYVAVTAPRRLRSLAPDIESWWRAETTSIGSAGQQEATRRFQRAHARFEHVMTLHTMALMSALTPLLQAVTNLVERTGVGSVGAFSGPGGAEMAIIGDIWRASRGDIDVADVVAAHGYHGPLEGEISSRVWREEPHPLHRLIEGYRGKGEAENPLQREEEARRRLPGLQRELTAQLPRAQRGPALALLRYAARTLPLRGVGKASFLQALDVARASARRLGTLLAEQGVLNDPEDVFYLTTTELATLPKAPRDLVARRRQNRLDHQQLTLPASWRGSPDVHLITPTAAAGEDSRLVTGIGVSAGTAEGPVRVITDPSFADVEPGEVLVAPTTDPSWASIMFLSSALVVDIGGALSHAAVVARELGIPCVVNTRSGTRELRTGDVVRVDGGTGTVEVLKAADA